ncbi:hypothetical protein AAVH_40702, partial [Aphelenchoides avenae]
PDCHNVCPAAFCASAKASGSCNNRQLPNHEGLKIAMIYCPVTCGFCTRPSNSPLPPSDPVWNTRCPKKYSHGGAPALPSTP